MFPTNVGFEYICELCACKPYVGTTKLNSYLLMIDHVHRFVQYTKS